LYAASEEDVGNVLFSTADDYRQKLRKIITVKEEPELHHELDTYACFMPSSGVSGQSGRVGIIDSASEYSYDFKVFGKLPVEVALATKYVGINNSTVVKLPANLTGMGIGAETTFPFFFDNTYLTVGLAPSFFTENWNINSSSFRLPQRYFLIFQPNEQWTFICGVGVFPGYEDNVAPIVGFIYKPNDKLAFNIVPKGPEISYDLNDNLTLLIEGDITGDEYEVTKDNLKNVVLEYNDLRLGTGFRYKINKYIKTTFSVGGVFDRSLRYRDDALGKVAIKNGLYT